MTVTEAQKVETILKRTYPDARCSLDFKTPFQLLVATVISAQCTDERVNRTTPEIFRRFPDAAAMARASLRVLEKLVQPTGFFRNKALALKQSAKVIVEKYDGEVPRTMEELTALRGIGRKTANVILGNAFGIPGLPVDTHVGRVVRRLGWTKAEDPVKVEYDLMSFFPKKNWVQLSHLLIAHGRAICVARKPKCEVCPVRAYCTYFGGKTGVGTKV